MPAKKQINLLPEEAVKKRRTSPLTVWFFRTGVYVLVGTYAVVIGAFVFRWYQDNRIAGVNDLILKKSQTIEEQQPVLAEFEDVQRLYSLVSDVYSTMEPKKQYLDLIEETIPHPIKLRRVEIDKDLISLIATTTDYLAVNVWQQTLLQSELIKQIDLKTLDRNESTDEVLTAGDIRFSFEIVLE